ncbi:MAG: helix-turn-helix domain-containing protein, partial [Ktedonobacteraceae bacterium]
MSLDPSDRLGQTVGARLRAARLAQKYTQNQLAQPDFSVSYISAIERGQIQPSLRALEIFAQRLGISSAHFLPQQDQVANEQFGDTSRSSQAAEERVLVLIEAEIALYQKQPTRAIELLRPLLHKGEPREQIAISYALGRAYLSGGYVPESEAALAEASHLAQVEADPLYARILHAQGDVSTAMHQLEQASHFQQASLAALAQRPELTEGGAFLAQVHNSLGQTYSRMGAFEQAREMFQQALTLLPPRNSLQQGERTPRDLAIYYQEGHQSTWISIDQYKQWQANLQGQLPLVKSEIQHALGRALLRSQPEDAYAHLLALSQQASTPQNALSRASARVHLAAWFFSHADFAQAESCVCEALELTHAFGENLIRADALILQGKLAYAQQVYE